LAGAGFLLLTFLVAALLKTAQGSSTSALVITSSMMAPLVETAGYTSPLSLALLVMAVGGGAMTVSHANDSYFWVVSQFSGLSLRDAYRGFSLMTLIQGLTVLALSLLVYVIAV
ncbi:MAG: GntP family permease, partial [Bacteroidetes bacterium]